MWSKTVKEYGTVRFDRYYLLPKQSWRQLEEPWAGCTSMRRRLLINPPITDSKIMVWQNGRTYFPQHWSPASIANLSQVFWIVPSVGCLSQTSRRMTLTSFPYGFGGLPSWPSWRREDPHFIQFLPQNFTSRFDRSTVIYQERKIVREIEARLCPVLYPVICAKCGIRKVRIYWIAESFHALPRSMKPSNPIFQKGIFIRSMTSMNEVYSKEWFIHRVTRFKALQTTEMDQGQGFNLRPTLPWTGSSRA